MDEAARPGAPVSRSNELIDVLVAPRSLFLAPDDPDRWRRFLTATLLLAALSGAILIPSYAHVTQPHRLPPFALWGKPLVEAIVVSLGIGLSFGIVLLMKLAGFLRVERAALWTLVNEIALVKLGLSTAVLSVIVLLIGAHITSAADIVRAMPSLAMLVPDQTSRAAAVLGVIDPFNLWVWSLYALAFTVVAGKRPVAAYALGFVVAILPQLLTRVLFGW
jgi:hypothetical protein